MNDCRPRCDSARNATRDLWPCKCGRSPVEGFRAKCHGDGACMVCLSGWHLVLGLVRVSLTFLSDVDRRHHFYHIPLVTAVLQIIIK